VLRVQAEKMAEEERLAAEEAAQMEEEMAALKSDEASLKMDGAEDANVDLNAVSGPDRRSDLNAAIVPSITPLSGPARRSAQCVHWCLWYCERVPVAAGGEPQGGRLCVVVCALQCCCAAF
jgi:hypothetical protein